MKLFISSLLLIFVGLVYSPNANAACVCGYDDGILVGGSSAITIDGSIGDWTTVLADTDNVTCDGTPTNGITDLDAPIQSTGRDLETFAFTWDATYFYGLITREGSQNNKQTFIFYADVNNDGFLATGEPVIEIVWQGNNGTANMNRYTYIQSGLTPDPMTGDGQAPAGTVSFSLQPLGSTDAQGSADGRSLEFRFDWSAVLGTSPGAPITYHLSSTNSQLQAGNAIANIDDNAGGCGGCVASTQYSAVTISPDTGAQETALGETVYFFKTITNGGNGSDIFDLESTSVGEFSTSVSYFLDNGTVGTFEAGTDTPLIDTDADLIIDTGSMTAGSSINIIIAVTSSGPVSGASLYMTEVTTTATSNFIAACGVSPFVPMSDSSVDTLTLKESDLTITKDDASATYTPGSDATYDITVTNNGPSDVVGAIVTDTLPAGLTTTQADISCSPANCTSITVTGQLITVVLNVANTESVVISVDVSYSADPANY
ncbi:MAG: DUF11 domain-containing protein [Gammaproteobacteria bacterium]|nr:DUF11 domain-containing protein [Gammaproteobacteria bacterium]